MIKTKNILLIILAFSTSALSIVAQETTYEIPEKIQSKAKNNWFISAGGSAGLLFGEQDNKKGIDDRLKFGGEFSVGKWFNPTLGMRMQYVRGNMRGFNYAADLGGSYAQPDRSWSKDPVGGWGNLNYITEGEGGFWQDFAYSSLTLDVMMNLSTLVRGYHKDNAFVEVIPFAGLGWIHSVKSNTNPTMDDWGLKVGARINFNLNKNWAIYLEPQGTFTNQGFDGYRGTRDYDMYTNLMLGVQFNINKNFSSSMALSQEEIDQLNNRINEQRQMIDNQQDILERQQRLLNELKETSKENVSVVEPQPQIDSTIYLPDYIRFGLNSSSVEVSESHKVEDAATFLKANPASKLLLIGYADRQTGNSKYNYELSCKRVDSVATQLKRMGINPSRLIIQCVGDKEQPYDQNDWNRVVIMVERK